MTFILSACGIAHGESNKIIEGSAYSEKIIDVKGKYNFDILCDAANISVYTWKKDNIKFEITRKVSGTYKKEIIDKKLEKFEIDIKTDDDTVFLKSRYTGGNRDSCNVIVEYTIYMPKSIDNISFKVGKGKIKLLDDIRGTLNAELDSTDIEINRFDGELNIGGNEGNVKISSGKISGSSKVIKKVGNISIMSEFDLNGEYDICTGLGHIDLLTAASTKVDFETVGELVKNEFAENGREDTITKSEFEHPYNGEKTAKVRVKSDMGKISIGKY